MDFLIKNPSKNIVQELQTNSSNIFVEIKKCIALFNIDLQVIKKFKTTFNLEVYFLYFSYMLYKNNSFPFFFKIKTDHYS